MGRQNPRQQLALLGYHQALIVERIISLLADQFGNIFFFEKIFVEPSNLREHLQIGEVLRQKISLCLFGNRAGTAKFFE